MLERLCTSCYPQSMAKKKRDFTQVALQNLEMLFGEPRGEKPPGEKPAPPAGPPKNQAAVELGRLGGRKGGKARAAKLSAAKRKAIAKKAARARWDKSS